MHTIEPTGIWKHLYDASDDRRSPFYGRVYNETLCTHAVYNYYVHPLWDYIGSSTLYVKLLYADYSKQFCIIELMGEWNDCLYNDIMYLKREVADSLMAQGINKFIVIGENVLNFHASENDYYAEWADDIENGWVVAMHLRKHVIAEFRTIFVDSYMAMGGQFNHINWRTLQPHQLLSVVEDILTRRLTNSNDL
ncbi:MAG TPA: hypothetical protein VLH16_06285 [Bacteroidales bacterium]|nr:hypothetical protein [Bacteroidales bacterium]